MVMTLKQCLSCGGALEQGLDCSYCGSRHLMTGGGAQIRCPECGAGTLPNTPHCTECGFVLLFACPECRTGKNPIGSRYCGECRIELASYRKAHRRRIQNLVPAAEIEDLARNWLASGWLRARDIENRFVLMDRILHWFPIWTFQVHARGMVQGRQAQTHYRTTSRSVFDHEETKWKDVVDSEPYTVWQDVRKDFDREEFCWEAASPDAPLLAAMGGKPRGLFRAEELTAVPTPCPNEEVGAAPQLEEEMFFALRKRALETLKAELLDEVQLLEARLLQPRLNLDYYPIWSIIYRYKRSRKRLWINGATREVSGQSVSLLGQWFS